MRMGANVGRGPCFFNWASDVAEWALLRWKLLSGDRPWVSGVESWSGLERHGSGLEPVLYSTPLQQSYPNIILFSSRQLSTQKEETVLRYKSIWGAGICHPIAPPLPPKLRQCRPPYHRISQGRPEPSI